MISILTDADVSKTYQILPIQVKEQVSNYLQFIIAQYHINIPLTGTTKNVSTTSSKRTLGGLEGKIWMSPDFNDACEDFEEYM